ncbi:hypothetical protein B0E37_00068 [Streptomyces sp. MH192]|nr:hypothetical protein [Streptomyces sp. MH192]MCF0097575.1 hypothetical protein [Streptomyces sp. MH191]
MLTQFMGESRAAEYLNVSLTWVYRDAPRPGLIPYKFWRGA